MGRNTTESKYVFQCLVYVQLQSNKRSNRIRLISVDRLSVIH